MKMIDCLLRSLALATARKAKKRRVIMVKVETPERCGAPAVQDQDWWSWCATGLVSAAWLPPPQRLPWMVVGASGGVRGRRLPA